MSFNLNQGLGNSESGRNSQSNYDSGQYQQLMNNFENLIKATQDKLNIHKNNSKQQSVQSESYQPKEFSIQQQRESYDLKEVTNYPKCHCGLEDTVNRQNREIEELKLKLELQRPIDLKKLSIDLQTRPQVHSQYLQSVQDQLQEKEQELMDQRGQMEQLYDDIQSLQGHLDQEKQQHQGTREKLGNLQKSYNEMKQKMQSIEQKEYQLQDKLTKEYSDIVLENINLKQQLEQENQKNGKLQLALNQSYLNQKQYKPKVFATQSCQTDLYKSVDKSLESINQVNMSQRQKRSESDVTSFLVLNTSLIKDEDDKSKNMRQLLKEKINQSQNQSDKFIQLYIESKKLKNRSQNEAKFYNELGKMLEKIKEFNMKLEENFINYTQEQDRKEEEMKTQFQQTLLHIQQLKEHTQKEIEQLTIYSQQKEQENEQLIHHLNQLQQQVQQLQTTQNELNKKLQKISQEKQDLEQQCDQQQNQIYDLEQEKVKYQREVKRQDQEINSLKNQKEYLEQDLEKCTNNIQNLEKESLQQKKQIQQQKLVTTEQLDQLNLKIEELELQNQSLRSQLERKQQELDKVLKDQQNLNQQNQGLLQEKETLFQSVEKVQSTQKELFNKHSALERQYGKIVEENENLKNQINEMESEIENRGQYIVNLENDKDILIGQQEDLEQKIMELVQEMRDVRNEYDQVLNDLAHKDDNEKIKQDEIEMRKNQIKEMESKSASEAIIQNKQVEELQSMLQGTEQELRMLQDYHEKALNEIETQREVIKQMENNKNQYLSQFESLQGQLDEMKQKERVGLHADYQQRLSFFQSKMVLLEEQIKELEEENNQLKDGRNEEVDGKNWEELLETSFHYNKQNQVKLKVLTEEIEKMREIIESQNGKISDLEYFIQKMLEDNEENRILAKQILIEQSQKQEDIDYNTGGTFGATVDSLEQ